jgi:hypothetical protein
MEDSAKSQKELAGAVFDISGETHGPDRHVVRAIGYQIKSNERLENSIDNFNKSTQTTEKVMVGLAVAQVMLALVTLVATFRR